MAECWYAVHSQAQKEPVAARELRRLGYQTFWPHTTEWAGSGHKAESRLVRRPWFSRYLFVRALRENLWIVNQAAGVSTVVFAPGGNPYPIADAVIDDIMARLGPNGKVFRNLPKNRFSKCIGLEVMGKEGWPIWGLVGEISRVLGDEIAVKMLMFGSEREIVVSSESVELSEAG